MMPKFKAFCKRHKCIEEVFQITYLGDNDVKVEAECLSGYVGSDFILMQSTGLYDKNGVEIFEGDIIARQNKDSKTWYVSRHLVVWHDTGFTGKQICSSGSYIGLNHWTSGDNGYVVIGNKYMNPELLGDRK